MIEKFQQRYSGEANLFSVLSHELKSSITLISGLSELLKNNNDVINNKELSELVGYIHTTSEHTHKLLDNVLNWSFLQNGAISFQPENLDVRDLINKELAFFAIPLEQKELSVNYSVSKENIYADKHLLGIIIRNLISNAIKFSYRGGVIDVKFFAYFDFYEFSVGDYGKGMNDATKNRLFRDEVHVSELGTENEKGTGLGLLLCKEFVHQHKGRLWVESELEKGSHFKFIIPNGGVTI